jgi:hypothetical protein
MAMAETGQYIWRYGSINVMYSPELDAGGSRSAPHLIEFIKDYFGADIRFGTVFEWCAGPAFYGFAVLAENLCDAVCLADINPEAIDDVNRTISENGLSGRARSYVSDNLASIPRDERFDLVLGNPPSWYAPNSAHPYVGNAKFDTGSHDVGWKIHSRFYSQILQFLNRGAFVLVQEVEPCSREVYVGPSSIPFDIRPQDQSSVFEKMIKGGGLEHVTDREFRTPFSANTKMYLQISRAPM